ncbi:MAG: hypothetical protein AAGF12_04485 [Myxococcota bacterium]
MTRAMERPARPGDAREWLAAGRVDLLFERYRQTRGVAARRFLFDALEQTLASIDGRSLPPELTDALATEGLEVESVEHPPQAALLPLRSQSGLGFLRPLFVRRLLDEPLRSDGSRAIPTWLAPSAHDAFNAGVRAGARYLGIDLRPEDHELLAMEGWAPSGSAQSGSLHSILSLEGSSLAGLGLVSTVSMVSDRPVRRGTAVSLALVDGEPRGVGGIAAKAEGGRARGDLRRWVVARENASALRAVLQELGLDHEVIGIRSISELVEAALEPTPRRRPPAEAVDDARRAFRGGWQNYRWPAQREPLERLAQALPRERADLRIETLTMLGAVRRHLGELDGSLAALEGARAILEREGPELVPDLPIARLHRHLALTLRQFGRPHAKHHAERAREAAERSRSIEERLKGYGTVGLIALSQDRFRDAVEAQEKALALALRFDRQAAVQTAGYLVLAHGRAKAWDRSRAIFDEGKAILRDLPAHGSSEAWLRTHRARALREAGAFGEITSVLDAPAVTAAMQASPLPGLLVRSLLGEALCRTGATERGYRILAASVAAYGRRVGPRVAVLAALNVLIEAEHRLEQGTLDPDTASRATLALRTVTLGIPRKVFSSDPLDLCRRLQENDPRELAAEVHRLRREAERVL